MSDSVVDLPLASGPSAQGAPGAEAGLRMPAVAGYALALLFVALATVLAFVAENLLATPNLTLIYVLPVIISAMAFGWGPSLIASGASVLAFDFFFTEPRYSFAIASPSDIWAAALLLVVGAIVSSLAAEARRRGLEARQAAEQAQALQRLAHVIIEDRAPSEIVDAAATALSAIFHAPAVVFVDGARALRPVGRTEVTKAEEEAALGALETRLPARAGVYPYADSEFDFWPVPTRSGHNIVLGVKLAGQGRERPIAPERFIDVVGAYLAAAFAPTGGRRAKGA